EVFFSGRIRWYHTDPQACQHNRDDFAQALGGGTLATLARGSQTLLQGLGLGSVYRFRNMGSRVEVAIAATSLPAGRGSDELLALIRVMILALRNGGACRSWHRRGAPPAAA